MNFLAVTIMVIFLFFQFLKIIKLHFPGAWTVLELWVKPCLVILVLYYITRLDVLMFWKFLTHVYKDKWSSVVLYDFQVGCGGRLIAAEVLHSKYGSGLVSETLEHTCEST